MILKNVAAFLLSASVVTVVMHYSRFTFAAGSTGGARVLSAIRDLEPGTLVTGADVAWRAVRVPRGLTPIAFETARQSTVFGSIVVTAVRAGEVVPQGAITPAGDGFSIAAAIAAGRNAVTIPADKIGSGIGLLSVGDKVDVVVSADARRTLSLAGKQTPTEELGSTLVVRGARVLNISPSLRRDSARNQGRAVTLDLSLDEAQRLALALTLGTLHLTLRSGNDTRTDEPRYMTTVNDLLAPRSGTVPEPGAKTVVTVIQGRKSQQVEVRR